jgi:hypothetical protein
MPFRDMKPFSSIWMPNPMKAQEKNAGLSIVRQAEYYETFELKNIPFKGLG